ncbi:MAG: SDR family NAD(P)-dependent oxidoreductase [Oscillospiraceae bacterium]
MKRLDGKVAIITGANSGVGAVTAQLFAAEGAKVVISARRVAPLEEVANKIKANGGEVLMVPTDISKPEDAKELIQKTVEAFGKIDILINNAGILDKDLNAVDRVDYEDLERVINTNEKGTIYCMSEALKKMGEGASIVNIASVAGYNGGGGAAYVASKAAIIGITKHTAMRFAKEKVRCNVVCPGMIITPMASSLNRETMDQKMMGAMATHSDLSVSPCMPEDVANIALFLASDESKAITGQVLVTDFGANL